MVEKLTFVPLGGSGEIGMNLNLYAYGDLWLMVDCGMMIDSSAGTDQIFVPDIEFLRKKKLAGLVITHAHEDHIGGITDLWLELRCPIYTTPFTAAVIKRKLSESPIKERVPIKIQAPGGQFTIADTFDCEFIPVTHSTVESQSVVIRTPVGKIFHTGDWKLDPNPIVGRRTAEKRIKELGKEGILAVVGDSTNAQIDGISGSEKSVRDRLRKLILQEKGRVVCTAFSSNIARLSTFFEIAAELQRNPIIIGRSLKRMIASAQETGYLSRTLPLVPPRDAMYLPPERVLLICTGSQGEARAALARIAAGTHPHIYLEENDTVFFSSKVIPGNEDEIHNLKAGLNKLGVRTIDEEEEENIHVSGHPCRDELRMMYDWLQPEVLIPVHGYPQHLEAHAQLAHECGIPQVIEVRNGDMVELNSQNTQIIGSTSTGRRLRIEEDWKSRDNSRRKRGKPDSHKAIKSSSKTNRSSKKVGQSSKSQRMSYLDSFRRGRR